MGKNDFLSPKGIANASKAKGLQKLRFYCQVCAKQCRDQNGFKCHVTSEAHLRQMELFGANQSRFIDGYSEEFLKEFLSLMSISHRNSRVAANVVYNEFISNKEHTHMNSTKWTSLTEFIKYLGREGIAQIDETPKGWFLTYVPEDREEQMRQASHKRKQKAVEESSVRDARLIEEQIHRAAEKNDTNRDATAATELNRWSDEKASFEFTGDISNKRMKRTAAVPITSAFGDDDDESGKNKIVKKPQSAIEEIMRRGVEAEKAKALGNGGSVGRNNGDSIGHNNVGHTNPVDAPWLMPNITVKIVSKSLRNNADLYKKKGKVVKTHDNGFVAEVSLIDSPTTILKIDQNDLETVLPKVDGGVVVVRGAFKGKKGTLKSLELEKFKAVVELNSDKNKSNERFEYEDVCKFSG
tara:strand:+ start:42486 stop:43718 length:1233 start_codon:yes stop_codon:yes gene_type:complete